MFSGVVWSFLVGRGDSRTPMLLAWVTLLTNIFLDWVLILGNLGALALGVAGAAYATVMANGLNAVLSAAILWNTPTGRLFLLVKHTYYRGMKYARSYRLDSLWGWEIL